MPELRTLCLGAFPCAHPVNSTIKSLVSIARYCKHLEELIIHTNIGDMVTEAFERGDWGYPTADNPHPALVGCPLRNIMFGPCFIPREQQGAMILALTLLRLFPTS